MLHIGVAILGAYYMLTALCMLVHTTARYYTARQTHVDFFTTLASPCSGCCCCCQPSQPIDGMVRILLAAILSFAEFSFDHGYQGDHDFLSRLELGTLYVCLLVWGVMDVLARWGSRTFYNTADYAGLVLFFMAQAAVLLTRAGYVSQQPVSSLQSLAGYTAGVGALVAVVEGVRREQVLPPVCRSFLLLLQGAWWLQAAVLVAGGSLTPATTTSDPDDLHGAVTFLAMLFCLHAALTLLVVLSVWLLVGRLVERGRGGCLGGGEGGKHAEDVFLENRVRFNYHVLSRLDSESE
ncbi:hypothetical protein ACOMHN_057467 [Nucella lapillus]